MPKKEKKDNLGKNEPEKVHKKHVKVSKEKKKRETAEELIEMMYNMSEIISEDTEIPKIHEESVKIKESYLAEEKIKSKKNKKIASEDNEKLDKNWDTKNDKNNKNKAKNLIKKEWNMHDSKDISSDKNELEKNQLSLKVSKDISVSKPDELSEVLEHKIDENKKKEKNKSNISKKIKFTKKEKRENAEAFNKSLNEKEQNEICEVLPDEFTKKLENFSISQQNSNNSSSNDKSSTNDIKIENFNISAGGKSLYTEASLTIAHGRRYGLVGPNGMGKSTLLTHIAAKKLLIPSHIDVLLCEQDFEADDTLTLNFLLNSDKNMVFLIEKEKKIIEKISSGDIDSVKDLKEIQEILESMKVESAKARACEILSGLGFTEKMMKKCTKDFSGGWRMRISLARALFIRPTLLLLDEPTNHLDLNAVIWLENYLEKWDKTLLVVSHDQHFLDTICTDVIHLDQKKLFYYKGNYEKFKKMYAQKMKELEKAYENQEKKLKLLKKSGKSTKEAEKSVKNLNQIKKEKGNKVKKDEGLSIAGSERKSELILRPREYVVKFSFAQPAQLSPPILGLKDVYFRYPTSDQWLFEGVNFGIDMSSRVAIVGPNGVGKSTLLKLLLKKIEPTKGDVITNARCRIAYFSQHSVDQLDLSMSPVEYLMKTYNLPYQDSRRNLGKFGLPGHTHEIKMELLSGGQKSRVALCDLAEKLPDIIIMDEPTNNLDIESIDALAEAIFSFEGGVVIVSHDARLILETNCILWIVEDHQIYEIEGDYNDYRQEILNSIEVKSEASMNSLSKM